MRADFESILARYGQCAQLKKHDSSEELDIHAFLQPVLKEQEHPPMAATPLGAVSRQRWVYVGSSKIDLVPGDRIHYGELSLVVQETHPLFCGDEIFYRWALLRREKEAAV